MPIEIQPLKSNDRAQLLNLFTSTYLRPNCYILALALHEGLGWDIVGIIKEDQIWHAGVKNPEGTLFDARGFVSKEEFIEPFEVDSSCKIRVVGKEELLVTQTIKDFYLDSALIKAQVLWPDLPWKKDSQRTRIINFATQLEKLSRESGVWVRNVPGGFTIMGPLDKDDVSGYVITPLQNGEFTIERQLHPHN